jgi:hypothetical protein
MQKSTCILLSVPISIQQSRMILFPLQTGYETFFAFSIENRTSCYNYDQIALDTRYNVYNQYWPYDWWSDSFGVLDHFRNEYPTIFLLLRYEIMNLLLQMRPVYYNQLKVKINQVTSHVEDNSATNNNNFRIGIHIRRTDKITSHEAQLVATHTYVDALLYAITKEEKSYPNFYHSSIIIYVISDDPTVEEEFTIDQVINKFHLVVKNQHHNNIQFKLIFRCAASRPDQYNKPGQVKEMENSLMELLIDFKLLVDADIFIGTQTSNLGLAICVMRGGHKCFSVENQNNGNFHFEWNNDDDKLV